MVKVEKNKKLSDLFEAKYKAEAEKFLTTNLEALTDSKPGQAFNILKKMGSQPGDCIDSNTFSLPSHENESLSAGESESGVPTPRCQFSTCPCTVKTAMCRQSTSDHRV